MNHWYIILIVFIMLLGIGTATYQLYNLTVLDARSRGLKKPKLWGFLVLGGQNNSGLLLYLLGRRKYPAALSEDEEKEIHSRKNKIGVGLAFFAVGAVVFINYAIFHF